ncbi:MAG: M23 family metallopeptidase [Acidobacteriota bacterium]
MNTFRTLALSLALVASLLSLPALAQPNVAIVDIQPSFANNAQAFPLAAASSLDDETFEISLDVTLRNDELVRVELVSADLVFGAGFTPMTSSLFPTLMMQCGGGNMTPLTLQNRIAPGQTCRLLLTEDTRLEPWVPQQFTLNLFFSGFSPLSTIVPIVNYSNSQPRGGFLFPAKVSDLAPDEFWSTRSTGAANSHRQSPGQMFAYDAGVARWDADAGVWTAFHPLDPGEPGNGDENEDWLVWGKPIYAMADGVVRSCTDGIADNVPGVRGNTSNSFVIDHGPERASYLHLMNGSTNGAICFNGAAVQAGDFLGLAGNSGWSSAPHLHVHVQRGGQGFPLLFRDAFLVDRNTYLDPPNGNADWEYVDGKGIPWEELVIWPSPLRRRDTLTAGTAWSIDLLDLSADTVVEARTHESGSMELRTWGRIGNGDLSPFEKELEASIKRVALAKPSVTSQFVTAVQTESDQLKVIAWDGFIGRQGDASGGQILDVAATTSPHMPGVVTAVRTDGGSLQVTGWQVDNWGNVQKGGNDVHGPISSVAIATAPAMGGVVTAVRTGGGELRLSSWVVSNNENFVDWRDDYTDQPVWDLDIAYLGEVNGRDRFLTAAENAAGNLYLVTWEVEGNGDIHRLDEAFGGPVEDVSVSDGGDSHALTAVIQGDDKFKLIGWDIASDGTIERHGEAVAEEVSRVAIGNAMLVNPTNRRQAVSVVRETDGDWRISSWEVALEP